jgi:type IV pilus assembly protein PilC
MKTRAAVEGGGNMEEALRQTRVVPPMVIDMIAIGDETGTLDTMLDRLADAYEDEVDASVRGLTAIIEPILIIFLGITVLIVALAILLPYWNIGDLVE